MAAFQDALAIRAGPIVNPLQDEDEPNDALDLIPVPLPPPPELPPIPPIPPAPRIDPCNDDPVIGGSGIYESEIVLGEERPLTAGTYVFNGSLSAVEARAQISGDDVQLWAGGTVDLSDAASVNLPIPERVSDLCESPGNAVTINPLGTLTTDISGSINVPQRNDCWRTDGGLHHSCAGCSF